MKRLLLTLMLILGLVNSARATQTYLPSTYVNQNGCAIPPATPCEVELTQLATTDINTGPGDDIRFVLFNLALFNSIGINPTQHPPLEIQLRITRDGTTIGQTIVSPAAGDTNIQAPVFLSGLATGQHSYQFFVSQNTSGPIDYTTGTYALVGALNVAIVSTSAVVNNSTVCTGSNAGKILYMNGSVVNCANGPSYNSGTDTVTATNFAGNASTATALAANPTDCVDSSHYAYAIDAQGNFTCHAITPAVLVPCADDQILVSDGTTFACATVPMCVSANQALNYNQSTNSFSCQTIAGSGAGYATVQDEGTNLPQRTTLDCVGAGIVCSDDGSRTLITVSGSGAGTVTGSGTTNHVAKWTSSSAIGDSVATDDGAVFSIPEGVKYTKFLKLQGITTITTDTTAGADDRYVRCVGGSGTGVTYTLPAATGSGRVIDVQKTDNASGACHVAPAGGDTIDTSASAILLAFGNNVTLIDAASGAWDAPLGSGGQGAMMSFSWPNSLSSTCYGPGKPDTGCFTANSTRVPVSRDGVLHRMYCSNGGTNLASGSYAFTMQKNGADTGLACTLGTAVQTCHDTTTTVNVVAGDTIDFKSVPSSPDVAGPANCTIVVE